MRGRTPGIARTLTARGTVNAEPRHSRLRRACVAARRREMQERDAPWLPARAGTEDDDLERSRAGYSNNILGMKKL